MPNSRTPTSDLVTTQLIEQALSGDRAAEDELVAQLTPMIKRYVGLVLARDGTRKRGDPYQDAMELTQEILLGLFKDAGQDLRAWAPSVASLTTYLGAIATNRARDSLRKAREQLLSDEPPEQPPPSSQDPYELIEDRDLYRAILNEMRARLTTQQQQQMFTMIFVDGLSVREICDKTGLTQDAAYKWNERMKALAVEVHDQILSVRGSQPHTLPSKKPR